MAVVASLMFTTRPGLGLGRAVAAWLRTGATLDERAVPPDARLDAPLRRLESGAFWDAFLFLGGLETAFQPAWKWLAGRPEPAFGRLAEAGYPLFASGGLRWTVRTSGSRLDVVFPELVHGDRTRREHAQHVLKVAADANGVHASSLPAPPSAPRRPKRAAPPGVVDDPKAPRARWTGASGAFAEGEPNARLHWQKHVDALREWEVSAMPDPRTYTQRGAALLDRLDVFEFHQPENGAVVKFDPPRDELVVGRRRDGALLTYFRPGGVSYAIRQLQRGRWQLPPRRGVLLPLRRPASDDVQRALDELAAAGAEVEGLAAEVLGGTAASTTLVSLLAAHTRLERLIADMGTKVFTTSEEERVEDALMGLGSARGAAAAAIDMPSSPHALVLALRAAVASWLHAPSGGGAADAAVVDEGLLRDALVALRAPAWKHRFASDDVLAAVDETRGWLLVAQLAP